MWRVREPLDATTPILPVVLDLARPMPTLGHAGSRYRHAHCLAVLRGRPVGTLDLPLPDGSLEPDQVADRVWSALEAEIRVALRDEEPTIDGPITLTAAGFDLQRASRPDPSSVDVVVATRDRPESLRRCLDSILGGVVRPSRLIVVDSASSSPRTRQVTEALASADSVVRYVREDRRGLARAHNTALAHVDSTLVAFTDDDVVADPWWLARMVGAFTVGTDVACVTGMIAPLELETLPQQLIEAHTGFSKGLSRRLVDAGGHRPDDPLFPFASGALGSGANMAFRTTHLSDTDGFDEALGAGTTALGGDDLAAFYDVIVAGHQLVYEPAAIVRHRHHHRWEDLERQAFGYGAGLSAHLTRCIVEDPRSLWAMARRVPRGVKRARQVARPTVTRDVPRPPLSLTIQQCRGMAAGPYLYLRSRRRQGVVS